MPSTQVQPEPTTQPTLTPTPKPDVKAMSEVLANLYTDYRTSDVAANKKFATVCRYYKEHPAITKAQLEVILQGTNLTEKSAEVEANRINNFRDDRNEFVLSEMEQGKLTINEARVLSTMKAMNQRDIEAKKAKGEDVPDTQQTSAGRKEFTPEKNCKNTLAKVVRYAIDGSLSDADVHAWLDEAFKATREDDIKKQQAKAEKEAQLKAESATTAQPPQPAPSDADLVHAAQAQPASEAVTVQAVQASPEAVAKLAKAIKGKK